MMKAEKRSVRDMSLQRSWKEFVCNKHEMPRYVVQEVSEASSVSQEGSCRPMNECLVIDNILQGGL